jgi:hypothetical protein
MLMSPHILPCHSSATHELPALSVAMRRHCRQGASMAAILHCSCILELSHLSWRGAPPCSVTLGSLPSACKWHGRGFEDARQFFDGLRELADFELTLSELEAVPARFAKRWISLRRNTTTKPTIHLTHARPGAALLAFLCCPCVAGVCAADWSPFVMLSCRIVKCMGGPVLPSPAWRCAQRCVPLQRFFLHVIGLQDRASGQPCTMLCQHRSIRHMRQRARALV